MHAVEVIHPRWSSWSFLVYAGGFTVLGATAAWLTYLALQSGNFGYVGWTLLVYVLLAVIATAFRRSAHPVSAGVFAFISVIAFVAFISALWKWFGWGTSSPTSSSFSGFHFARLVLELLWLFAAVTALRVFRFPLIAAQLVLVSWLFFTDLISNGGGWSAIVTIFVGLCFLSVALVVDAGPSRPYGFWLHLGAGLTIGGGLLWFWHDGGSIEWTLAVIVSVIFVYFAQLVGRSSWAVLGAIGLYYAAVHFTLKWTHVDIVVFSGGSASARAWVPPLVFSCLGFLLVALGLALARRSSDDAVVR